MRFNKYIPSIIIIITIFCSQFLEATTLVIIHTNDTHSQIDPDENNLGGILRRKVLIDSVRGAVRNVMLVDAGDAVQGTLYYHLFKGDVESKMPTHLLHPGADNRPQSPASGGTWPLNWPHYC